MTRPTARRIAAFMLGVLMMPGPGFATTVAASAQLAPSSVNLVAWPRMSARDFGCYMEKTFGHRDKRFNCAMKRYSNQGDPCKNTRAYYEGPTFPDSLAARVHPLATHVELSWEHGELQQVSVTLRGTFAEPIARRAFGLPDAQAASLPVNVMSTDIQQPGKGFTDVSLTGFDHMGAGDVDCGG